MVLERGVKKHRCHTVHSSLPILTCPACDFDPENPFPQLFSGIFRGSFVEVRGPRPKVLPLHRHGCFGKGSLSRSEPNFVSRKRRLDDEDYGEAKRARTDVVPEEPLGVVTEGVGRGILSDVSMFSSDDDMGPEVFCLSLCEAFFLSYALGCLTVLDEHRSNPLSLEDQWNRYRAAQPDFVSSYAVYHHLRVQHWVPKSGLKYGVHWIIYPNAPSFEHAHYGVLIEERTDGGGGPNSLCWARLQNLSRLSVLVSKGLMVCQVILPAAQADDPELYNHPDCLERIAVREFLFNRWTAERDR